MSVIKNSEQLCEKVAQINDTVILSFSLGKDSIASFIQLNRFFKKVIPVYMYTVPNLSFIQKSVEYYEDFFNTHIYQIPHPNFIKMLNTGTLQSPSNYNIIQDFDYPDYDYEDVISCIRDDYCAGDKSIYNAVGCRMGDSPWRNIVIKKYQGFFENSRKFYPVYDWNNERLKKEFIAAGVKLPIDYQLFGRSYDGIMALYTSKIKEHFPEDFEKIKTFFPLIEADIYKHKFGANHV